MVQINLNSYDINAAVLNSFGALDILKIKPKSLNKGQVFVKVLYSGLCRSQLMEVYGQRGKDKWLPHLLGHEATWPGPARVFCCSRMRKSYS
jgi:D-arabinose 1-dehydrogenase-like Zn-dependent alcohol dehydrogenase